MRDLRIRTEADGRIARRVLLPVAIAAKADRIARGSSIEAFSALINQLISARLFHFTSAIES